jgi:hypothetical protein
VSASASTAVVSLIVSTTNALLGSTVELGRSVCGSESDSGSTVDWMAVLSAASPDVGIIAGSSPSALSLSLGISISMITLLSASRAQEMNAPVQYVFSKIPYLFMQRRRISWQCV